MNLKLALLHFLTVCALRREIRQNVGDLFHDCGVAGFFGSRNRVVHAALEPGAELARLEVGCESRDKGDEEATCVVGVGLEITVDNLDGHGFLIHLPAVVVSDHTDHLIRNLSFSSQLRLRKRRPKIIQSKAKKGKLHIDDMGSKVAVHVTFRTRTKGWPLHTDQHNVIVPIRLPGMKFTPSFEGMARRNHILLQLDVKRICKHSMSNQPLFKKSPGPKPPRPINNLIRDQKVPWTDMRLQTPDRGKGYDGLDANVL